MRKTRKSILVLCVLIILAALVAIHFNHSRHNQPVASVPEVSVQTEASEVNNLPPPQTVAKTETPAPVASESTNTNRVTVDFSGVQPVIK